MAVAKIKANKQQLTHPRVDANVVEGLGRGMGILGWRVYLALSQEDATDGKGDGSAVIVAIFLVAVGQFSPLGAPNSRLSQRSGTRK